MLDMCALLLCIANCRVPSGPWKSWKVLDNV